MDDVFMPCVLFLCLLNTVVLIGVADIVKRFVEREADETSFTPLVKRCQKQKKKRKSGGVAVDPFLLND